MIEFITTSLPARHGFFGRQGGVSQGAYASLNCGLSTSDDPAKIAENRARVATAMNIAPEKLLGLKQVHGADAITITTPWTPGDGPTADAMVSNLPGYALGIITADCAPVLFADRRIGIIGAAHAGWRGALGGVLEATVAHMRGLGGTEIFASIGPCIHGASYEVSADLRDPVITRNPADALFFEAGRPGHWQFDLPGYCAARLSALGVPAQIVAADTYALEDSYFSNRRRFLRNDSGLGHQLSVIRL